MASGPGIDEELEGMSTRIPRRVEGGTEYLDGLGKFIDDLLGDSRLRARTRAELEPFPMKEEEMPEEPPPSEPPPPVPDGTRTSFEGEGPAQNARSRRASYVASSVRKAGLRRWRAPHR